MVLSLQHQRGNLPMAGNMSNGTPDYGPFPMNGAQHKELTQLAESLSGSLFKRCSSPP
ncbi:hypothetical protein BS47DRAFT_1349137 [Hydnum rufescens UP504]|uniref:Uncharacterized protein n=1 Tax=Hydnum rufescens UP504 TaxID=1448309 RepID=A0A9P6DSG3_9AGAM|nr:hypothetical protein BS47DRAFT_1349137 [Hydnum rufescens UP504]